MLASVAPLLLLAASAAAQSTTTLCVAGLCLQGSSNISIGAVVSRNSDQFVLLPGTYSPTTEPQPLRDALTSGSSRLSYSPGFSPNPAQAGAQPVVFPVTIALQPGVLSTTASLYRGQTAYHPVPDAANASISASSQTGGSIVVSKDVWAAFKTGAGDSRLVLWDSVADLAELPSGAGASTLSLVDVQSTTCSPACSGNGICTPQGKCVCPPGGGFQGASCEACADGFFGPQCQPCPDDCDKCDDGATGSGKCLVPKVTNAPSTCNCANGECGTGGTCACNEGWADSPTGAKCSVCREGYFKTAKGDCQICFNGCTRCLDGRGTCSSCSSGLNIDGNDPRTCTAPADDCGGNTFPDGSGGCATCSPQCRTCSSAGPAGCLDCADRTYKFDGLCVPVNNEGVCSGTKRVANQLKGTCDVCPAGCAECGIPNFSTTSIFDNTIQCTKCLPGTVLSNGKCIESCPAGTFISAGTCAPCDSSCSSCAGDAKFCLACSGGKLAHEGTCGTSCPSGTFSSSGACLACHGDCSSCSGGGFDQCTSCSASRPVLQASGTSQTGRCLPTCAKNQFFDSTSNKCQACDSSCSSCSGSGPGFCLACASTSQVVKGGACVDAKCERGSSVVPGLGACLSALVAAPFVDNTNPNAPPPPPPTPSGKPRLAWWEILLMVLGCAFIVLVVLMLWRRRMRKKRAAQTAEFARKVQHRGFLARSVHWLGGKLFHHRVREQDVDGMVARMRAQELERHKHEMEMLEVRAKAGSAKFPIVHLHQDPNPPPPHDWDERSHYRYDSNGGGLDVDDRRANRLSDPSVYSVMTGVVPRRPPSPPPEPSPAQLSSRFSTSTDGMSIFRTKSEPNRLQKPPPVPPPQPSYDPPLEHVKQHRTGDSYESNHSQESTGSQSRNPFRR